MRPEPTSLYSLAPGTLALSPKSWYRSLNMACALAGLSLAFTVNIAQATQAETTTTIGEFDVKDLVAINVNPGTCQPWQDCSSDDDPAPVSGNLLENGNVENGLSPWQPRGDAQAILSTNIKHSGGASVFATNRNAVWHGVAYPIDRLTPNNAYEFQVWVRLADGTPPTNTTLTIEYQDSNGTQYRNVATVLATSDGWTQINGSYTHMPTGNTSGIKAYIESDNATVSYYVDDLSMTGEIDPDTTPPTDSPFFVGNITTSGEVRSDFVQFWNQITPENEGKWGSVERSRGQYNWAPLDRIYSYARQNNIPVKGHTLVWGSQCPSWVGGSKCEGYNLSGPELAKEIEDWIRDYCTRYPDTKYMDVVNESTPGHAPAGYAQKAFGNNWIIKSFQLARQYCPNTTLILNDYNVLSWNTQEFINMARPAVAAGVVDAIGLQAHGLESWSLNDISTKLNQVAALGLPVYISEYDVAEPNDQRQLQIFQQQFPLFYNHPSVKGITLWGYVYGKTWVNGSGLIRENGAQRPAMTWLMNYLRQNPK